MVFAKDLKVGDRIGYKAKDLVNSSDFLRQSTPLTADVIFLEVLTNTHIVITTVSGKLKACSPYKLFEIVEPDFQNQSQTQYLVNPPETFQGFSIE
jgi:hypothetical protein